MVDAALRLMLEVGLPIEEIVRLPLEEQDWQPDRVMIMAVLAGRCQRGPVRQQQLMPAGTPRLAGETYPHTSPVYSGASLNDREDTP